METYLAWDSSEEQPYFHIRIEDNKVYIQRGKNRRCWFSIEEINPNNFVEHKDLGGLETSAKYIEENIFVLTGYIKNPQYPIKEQYPELLI